MTAWRNIVGKDVRRAAPAVLVWVAFLIGTSLWFRAVGSRVGAIAYADNRGWPAFVFGWGSSINLLYFALLYLISGAVLLEDPLIGTSSFWMTRPIARWRLFGAKLTMLALLVGFSGVVLGLIWLGFGATFSEVASVVGGVTVMNLYLVGFAALFGSLSRTSSGFALITVTFIVVAVACFAASVAFGSRAIAAEVRGQWVLRFTSLSLASMLTIQALCRQRRWTWFALVAAVVVASIFPVTPGTLAGEPADARRVVIAMRLEPGAKARHGSVELDVVAVSAKIEGDPFVVIHQAEVGPGRPSTFVVVDRLGQHGFVLNLDRSETIDYAGQRQTVARLRPPPNDKTAALSGDRTLVMVRGVEGAAAIETALSNERATH